MKTYTHDCARDCDSCAMVSAGGLTEGGPLMIVIGGGAIGIGVDIEGATGPSPIKGKSNVYFNMFGS